MSRVLTTCRSLLTFLVLSFLAISLSHCKKEQPAPAPKDNLVTQVVPTPEELKATLDVENPRLTWKAVVGAILYEVVRSQSNSSETLTIQVPSNQLDLKGQPANENLSFKVRAFNGTVWSEFTAALQVVVIPIPTAPPAAPSGLTVLSTTTDQVNLRWTDNSSNESAFEIERSPNGTTGFTKVGEVGANATQYTATGLNASTDYFFRARAKNLKGPSLYSSVVSGRTQDPPVVVNPPSTLTASAVRFDKVELRWTDESNNESGFKIEMSTNNGAFVLLGQVASANSTTITVTNLNGDTPYKFRIFGFAGSVTSTYSNEASATTPSNPPGILAPTNLTAQIVNLNQIALSWQDNSNNEEGFKINEKVGTATFGEVGSVGQNIVTFPRNISQEGSFEYYVVGYYFDTYFSGDSNHVTVGILYPPNAPTNLTAPSKTARRVNLAWVDNANNETGFEIEKFDSATNQFVKIGEVAANTLAFEANGLSPSTEYQFRVRAIRGAASSDYVGPLTVTTEALPPLPVFNGVVTPTVLSSSEIRLEWQPASNQDHYELFQKNGTTFNLVRPLPVASTSTVVDHLSEFTEFTFKVVAVNDAGISESGEVSARTKHTAPPAPTGLVALPKLENGVRKIDLAFSFSPAPAFADHFDVFRMAGTESSFSLIGTVAAADRTFSDQNVSAGLTYSYKVAAVNESGSADTSVIVATAIRNAPKRATGLAVAVRTVNSIKLTWLDGGNDLVDFEDTYEILRSDQVNGTYTKVGEVPANVLEFTNTSLTAVTTYFYKVRAVNAGGNADTDALSAITLHQAPNAPTALAATPLMSGTTRSIRLNFSFTDETPKAVDHFGVFRRLENEAAYVALPNVSLTSTAREFTDTTVQPGLRYFYQVEAVNDGGNTRSGDANATVAPLAPPAPTNLTLTVLNDVAISMSWTDNSDLVSNSETKFEIRRSTTGATNSFTKIGEVAANVSVFTDEGGVPSTKFYYQIRAVNAGGESFSNVANATTAAGAPPGAPSGLIATSLSPTEVRMTWRNTSGTSATGYEVWRKVAAAADSTYARIATVPSGSTTTYLDANLVQSTNYEFKVLATTSGGNSSFSNKVTAKTHPVAPSALGLTAVSNTEIKLDWTDNSTESRFEVEMSTDGVAFVKVGQVGSNVKTFTKGGLTQDSLYYFRVRAVHVSPDVFSGYSNIANKRTLKNIPAAPTSLVATVVSQTQVRLTWTDNSNNEDGFKLFRKTGTGAYAVVTTFAASANTGATVVQLDPTTLTANTPYTFQIRATNNGGDSSAATSAQVTTLPNPPAAVTGLALNGSVTFSTVPLKWNDNSNNETATILERSADNGTTFARVAVLAANVTSFTDVTNLLPDRAYKYRVTMSNTGGISAFSNILTVTTAATPPGIPGSLVAVATSVNTITLTWIDGISNETSFVIKRLNANADGSCNPTANVTATITVAANTTTTISGGLSANTSYCYRMFSRNSSGDSAYSNLASAKTPAQ